MIESGISCFTQFFLYSKKENGVIIWFYDVHSLTLSKHIFYCINFKGRTIIMILRVKVCIAART